MTSPTQRTATPPPERPAGNGALLAIALFKLAKGIFFLVLAAAALRLMRHDVNDTAHYWLQQVGIKEESRHVQQFLERFGPMIDSRRKLISPILTFYAVLFFVEGIGLWLRKRWAEYFTVFMTASLVPVEVYEIFVKVTPLKVGALLANLLVLTYLVIHLRLLPVGAGRKPAMALKAAPRPERS